jgi:hypothetical protein
MVMKVDYGVVTKAIMIIKLENVIFCFGIGVHFATLYK